MVGLVIASHSRALAEAVVDLAQQMASPDIQIAIAAGAGEDHREFGVNAIDVYDAIQSVYSPDGVVVLMDLGSAVLGADMALEMLPDEMRPHIRLCAGPLIEGALSAAVQAGLGLPVDAVCDEAQDALRAKAYQLGIPTVEPLSAATAPQSAQSGETDRVIVTLTNPHGLHARPAARFVQTAASFDADVRVRKLLVDKPGDSAEYAPGKSLTRLATLGAVQGDQIEITAQGPQAAQALDALRRLVESGFGEGDQSTQATQTTAPPLSRAPDAAPLASTAPLPAIPISEGISIGPLYRYRAQQISIDIPDVPALDTAAEWQRLQQAVDTTRHAIQQRRQQVGISLGDAQAAIFDAHALILQDEALLNRARILISAEHHNALKAWHLAVEEVAAAYHRLADPYLQQRAQDVQDVGSQVLQTLAQTDQLASIPFPMMPLPGPVILVAPELTPTQIAQLDLEKVLGLITSGGSPNSHAAILTRALGIPGVAAAGSAMDEITEGTLLALDGFSGDVWVHPSSQMLQELAARRTTWRQEQQRLRQASQAPTVTRDGRRVEVAANLGGLVDAPIAIHNGAEAIGVLRTEFLYLTRTTPPSEDEQVAALRQVAEQMHDKPVIVRTLDVGGDKAIPYLPLPGEANPFLGMRAIRLSLQQPDLFVAQVRAILRAGADRDVRILLPMVTLVEELEQARQLIERAHYSLDAQSLAHRWPMPVGIMVETPAAALLASAFAPRVDFFSIGTNDLTQYTLAAERGNPALVHFGDSLHPVILRLVRDVIDAAHQHGKWAGVCGEIASDPIAVPILIGLDADELSLNAAAIPQVKAVIRTLDVPAAQALAQAALQANTASEVRLLARRFAGSE